MNTGNARTEVFEDAIDPVQIDQTRALTEAIAKLIDPTAFPGPEQEARRLTAIQRAHEIISLMGQHLK